jgi:(4S)-4-hydroxy-5-phosphonooxypentane-2,3-dione isomerase
MLVVNVEIRVKIGMAEAFVSATSANREQSRREPGVVAFGLLADPDDEHHCLLVEGYRNLGAPAAHKQTPHYERWRAAVEPMMQVTRSSTKWNRVTP